MTRRDVYDSPLWPQLRERVLARDGRRCLLAWVLGGPCDASRHVHHIQPVEDYPDLAFDEDNLVTTCAHHHPMLEALRRAVARYRAEIAAPRRCPHRHTNRAGREACERDLNAA